MNKRLIPDGCRAFDPAVDRHEWAKTGVVTKDGLVRILWDTPIRRGKHSWEVNSGTTEFRKDDKSGWRSYDRRGIDSSFYFKDAAELAKKIPEEIARARRGIVAALEPHFSVPGLPFSLRAERRDALRKQLKERGSIDLTPSGFGTGYNITTRSRGSFSQRGSAALCEFFEVKQCWLSTFDYD